MARHAAIASASPSSVSPKVSTPTLVVLGLAALTAFLSGITPQMLDFLGVWSGPAFLALGAVIQFLTGYAVKDPARGSEAPAEAPEPEAEEDNSPASISSLEILPPVVTSGPVGTTEPVIALASETPEPVVENKTPETIQAPPGEPSVVG